MIFFMPEHVQTRFGATLRAVFVYVVLSCSHVYLLYFDLMQAFSNIYETRRSLFLNSYILNFIMNILKRYFAFIFYLILIIKFLLMKNR